ncbi:MAG: flagellar hook-length control protein FliK, partial [Pseudomonadota bacterium]
MANAQSVQDTQLPDFARTTSLESRPSTDRAVDAEYSPPSARSPEEPRPSPDPVREELAKYDNDDKARAGSYADDAALPALTDASTARSGNAPSSPGAERTAASTTQTANTPPTTADTASQQNRASDDAAAQMLKAQIVDGAAKDKLPQLRHTLSSGAAIVAQSGGKGAISGDGATTGQGNTASSIAAGAAQGAAQAGQKAKAQTTVPSAAATGASQNSSTAATLQPVPTVAAGNGQFWQQGSNQSSLLNGGAAKSTPLATGMARTDGLASTGDGSAGFQVPIRPAAQSLPQKPLPPVPPRLIANQVAVQIQKGLSQGGDRISIQLKPAELGRVDVRLDMVGDGRVAAVVTADRADTLELLQRDARLLQSALQDAGLQADGNSLSFELKGQNGGQSGSANETATGTSDVEEDLLDPSHSFDARPSIVSDDRV